MSDLTDLIEWHEHFLPPTTRAIGQIMKHRFSEALRLQECIANETTVVVPYDDETFLHDRKPLPLLCAASVA